MTPRERAKRGEGEKLRQEIVDAGQHLLFDTRDEEAVTIRAVAKAVGVSPPSIYLHFQDKAALLLAVCVQTFDTLDAYIEERAAGIDDPRDALRVRGEAYVRFGLENPEHYRILFMTRPTALDAQELPAPAAFEHHLAAVQRVADAGGLRPDVDPMLAAMTLWAGAHGLTSLLIAKPFFPWPDLDQLIEHHLAALVDGLVEPVPTR